MKNSRALYKKMKKTVIETLRVCQIFYALAHITAVVIFIFTENESISLSLSSIIFWLLKVISGILFFTAGINPGYCSESIPGRHIELQEAEWNVPTKLTCSVCDITQPYRSKHCDLCEECIGKYDHHCF